MTQDPYRLDEELQLAAVQDDGTEDEFDGLDLENEQPVTATENSRRSLPKMPILIGGLGLLVVLGGGFYAYQTFFADMGPMGAPVIPPPPPQPMPPQAPPVPADMPPAGDAAVAPVGPNDPAAVLPPGTEAVPPGPDMPIDPVDPAVAPAEAVPADAAIDPADPDVASQVAVEKDVVEKTTETQVEPEPDVPPALAETVAENEDQPQIVTGESVRPEAMPEPSPTSALKPIDPESAAAAEKAAKTIAEVNKILGQDSGAVAATSTGMPALPPLPEVTPRARQVIVVKKAYSARSPQAVVAAGDRLIDAQQYEAAADVYAQQLKQNPSDPRALAGKAIALQRAGNAAEAMNTYDRLLQLNPRDVEALTNYLGLLQSQDPQQALSRLQQLATQYPENAAVAAQLGSVYARMRDTPNALRYLMQAQALDSNNPVYPFNLAVLYDRLGTTSRARAEYARALQLANDYPSRSAGVSVDVIRRRLASMRN